MNNYDYPVGSDTEDAPWNETEQPERKIEVTISVTLSKTVEVSVNDYKCVEDIDEEGRCISYDYTDCDLKSAVECQIFLPQHLAHLIDDTFNSKLKSVKVPKKLRDAINDCKNWNIDDFEVVSDE